MFNFFFYLVSRGPGKRQIKPTVAVFQNDGGTDDDEEDEDFNGIF